MTAPTRIGYLVSQYPAPSHTFIRREVAALRAAGVDVATYSIRPPPAGVAADDTFTVLRQPAQAFAAAQLTTLATRPGAWLRALRLAWRHRVPGARAALWALFHFAEAVLLARQLRRDGIGHLHNHFANAGATVGLIAAQLAGVPWSLTLHGISEFDYPAGLLLRDKVGAARFVACVSRFGMAQAMRLTPPAWWDRFVLVRCGIDPVALPARAPRPADAPLAVIALGRLSPEKAQAGLLAACALLRDRGVPVRLTLAGDGPDEAALRAAVAAHGLGDAVAFAGRLDEAQALAAIARADVLALPSFMEGLPVVLMEAMALGIPVVATRVAGIPELVRDEDSGLLFDPADWAGLADALARLARDPDLRARLAAAGRARVAADFTIDRAVAPLLPLFGAPPP